MNRCDGPAHPREEPAPRLVDHVSVRQILRPVEEGSHQLDGDEPVVHLGIDHEPRTGRYHDVTTLESAAAAENAEEALDPPLRPFVHDGLKAGHDRARVEERFLEVARHLRRLDALGRRVEGAHP
jgi:hypothetical protein